MERETKTMKNEEIRDKSGGIMGGAAPGTRGPAELRNYPPSGIC